jgi:DNA-directed RNA polymerase specialized sigma24 family protein
MVRRAVVPYCWGRFLSSFSRLSPRGAVSRPPMIDESTPLCGFPTTHWSRVVAAGDGDGSGAREALAELCSAYWFPLYAFVRRKGNDTDRALDLTQAYFARLLERRIVAAADPARGRFRSFLRTDCSHFLAHERERDGAACRCGGRTMLVIAAGDAESRYRLEPSHGETPERLFDRDWALALLESVLAGLRLEYERTDRGATFEVLKVVLTEGPRSVRQAELAKRLGTTEAAAQVAVHRLRSRYRDAIHAAIAATVADEAEVDDELSALFVALGA